MTRFARAQGSKSSNERLPEPATPWTEMKQQLEDQKQESEQQKLLEEANKKRTENYDKFLKAIAEDEARNAIWAEFPLKNPSDDEAPEETSAKVAVPEVVVKKAKNKKRKLKIPLEDETENKKSKPEAGVKKGKKKSGKKPEPKPKKSPSEMTEIELKKYEKKKEKRVKQVEKRKQVKAEMKEKGVTPKKSPKKKPDLKPESKPSKRKPSQNSFIANGREIPIAYMDGFPIKQEDFDRIQELHKQMVEKGLPRDEIKVAMKLERRRAEKVFAREKKRVCFQCRKAGHNLSECPGLTNEVHTTSGICFKCGSTEHTHFECKVVKSDNYGFAKCFICNEQGHIARQCPANARGLYPKGGACNVCGDVTHLKRDCPKYQEGQEAEMEMVRAGIVKGAGNPDDGIDDNVVVNNKVQKKNKVVKF